MNESEAGDPRGRHATVIGAGNIGICSAAYLRRAGYAVTVVDRVPPGMSTSFGNAGSLSPSANLPVSMPGMLGKVPGWLLDPLGPLTIRWPYLPIVAPWLMRFLPHGRPAEVRRIAAAMRQLMEPVFECYEPLIKDAGAEHLIRRNGCLYVYESEAEFQAARFGIDLRRDLGARFDEIGADEIHRLEPAVNPMFPLGLFAPDNGSTLDPQGLVMAIADSVLASGGEILERDVLDIEMGEKGPCRLITDGAPLEVDILVVAAGAWSGKLARRLGHKVPLETQRGYHVTLSDPGIEISRTVMWNRRSVFVNPMSMGLRFAGTVEFAGLEPEPRYRRAEKLEVLGKQMFPDLDTSNPDHWMGHRPCLPDSLPVIDRARAFPDVVFAFGHQHVGMCCGAPTGRLVSELVRGVPTSIDLAPFRIDRF